MPIPNKTKTNKNKKTDKKTKSSGGDDYPFLSVRIFEIVEVSSIPRFAETEQLVGQETVLTHDEEVGEETGRGLHHTDLTVSHRNQPVD